MSNSSLLINQGTNSSVNFDSAGGTFTQVIGVGYGTISTLGTIPNIPGGTINAGTVQLSGGTLNLGTVAISNSPAVTITSGSINGTVVANVATGTINVGTATVSGKDAPAAARTANPVVLAGTDSGGTVYAALTDTSGHLKFDLITGTLTAATVNTGTVNTGTINVATVTAGSIIVTNGTVVNNGGSVQVYGGAGSAVAVAGNPVYIAGQGGNGTTYPILTDTKGQQIIGGGTISMVNAATISSIPNIPGGTIGSILGVGALPNITIAGGTIQSATVSAIGTIGTLGLGSVVVNSLPNLPQGSINVTAGTISAGTINLGTIVGKDANAAVQTGNPIAVAGTNSGGSIVTLAIDASGNLKTTGVANGTTVGTINVGTINTGTINTGTINTGTINAGTINSVGTVTDLSQFPAAAAGSDTIGNPTTTQAGALLYGWNGGANWERIRADLGDTSPATGLLVNNPLLYNGSTYDRARGDTTNGLWVNVKTGTITRNGLTSSSGSLTAAGTVSLSGSVMDAISLDIEGTWVGTAFFEGQTGTSSWFAIPAIDHITGISGTQTTVNGNWFLNGAGLSNARVRLTYSSGTFTYNAQPTQFQNQASSLFSGSLTNLGMLNAGTISMLNAGTISTLPNIPGGSIVMTAGTQQALGTIGTLGLGTVKVTSGTINVGTVTSNQATGTQNVGTINTGTINTGTINVGTFQINPLPATNTISHAGTSGTIGIGTLVGTSSIGVGTALYITRYSILSISGTPEVILAFGSQTNGNQVVAHGLFPAGAGIAMPINEPHGFGTTNSPLTYQILSGAGTVAWDVDYFVHT